jgi:anti-sigma regulatory factor (Ser/Thr protein kinase)
VNVARGWALPVIEASQVGEARRRAVELAVDLGFPETARGRLALVVTEAAGNLVKHASRGGELLVRVVEEDGVHGLEVLALDQGPGMPDVGRSLQDGHSTTGTAGTGLGAISRLSDDFQIQSAPGLGTALLARLWSRPPPRPPQPRLRVGVVSVPKPGEEVCGDGWAASRLPGQVRFLVVDGLGHGEGAAEASRAAARAFLGHPTASLEQTIETLHDALHGTRGAAAAVLALDAERRSVRFAGIGNIAGSVLSPGRTQSMVSHHGIVGHRIRKVQEFTYDWPEEAMLVLHSDGLTERMNLDRYPGLRTRDPSLVAGILYRDFARRTDDATVLVAREAHPE